MCKPNVHVFHFIMDREMKKNLLDLNIFTNTQSLSGIIVKIFSLIAPLIRKEHKWGKQRASKYLPVCNDPDEVRKHVHVYFPEEVYRQLKLMHVDLNCFSMAQFVRGFLRFFLVMVKKYGKNAFQELKKVFKKWQIEDAKIRLTPRQIIQQLLLIILHFSGKNRVISIYDRQFIPSWIFLL